MNDGNRSTLPAGARAMLMLIITALVCFALLVITGSLAGVVGLIHWIVVTLRSL